MQKARIIVSDIDGVLANCSARMSHCLDWAAVERKDFNAFNRSFEGYDRHTHEDTPIPEGITLVEGMRAGLKADFVLHLTSRLERTREDTLTWLKSHVPWYVHAHLLSMLPDFQETPDGKLYIWKPDEGPFDHAIYKTDVVRNVILPMFDIVMCVEDNLEVAQAYEAMDLPVIALRLPNVRCVADFTRGRS